MPGTRPGMTRVVDEVRRHAAAGWACDPPALLPTRTHAQGAIAARVLRASLVAANVRVGLTLATVGMPNQQQAGRTSMKAGYRVSLWLASSLLTVATVMGPALARDDDRDNDRCANSRDVRLVNGIIHTLDARNTILTSVTIKNGTFAGVGHDGDSDGGPCMR